MHLLTYNQNMCNHSIFCQTIYSGIFICSACAIVEFLEDFEPEVVRILLLYLYNGAICWYDIAKNFEMFESVMKIPDKYNFTALRFY